MEDRSIQLCSDEGDRWIDGAHRGGGRSFEGDDWWGK
jgi:hypothetical protein